MQSECDYYWLLTTLVGVQENLQDVVKMIKATVVMVLSNLHHIVLMREAHPKHGQSFDDTVVAILDHTYRHSCWTWSCWWPATIRGHQLPILCALEKGIILFQTGGVGQHRNSCLRQPFSSFAQPDLRWFKNSILLWVQGKAGPLNILRHRLSK